MRHRLPESHGWTSPFPSTPQIAPDSAGGAHTLSPDWRRAKDVQTSSPMQPQPSTSPRHVTGSAGSQGRTQVRTPPRSANTPHTAPSSQIALARLPQPSRFTETAKQTSPAPSRAVQAPVRFEDVTQLVPSTGHTAKHAGPSSSSERARLMHAAPSSQGVLAQLFAKPGGRGCASPASMSSGVPSSGTGQPTIPSSEQKNKT